MKAFPVKPVPWVPFRARKKLDTILTNKSKVFEWGSGGSTLYFAKKAFMVVSIEYRKEWYRKILAKIHKSRLSNVVIRLVQPKIRKRNSTDEYYTTDKIYKRFSFEEYCKAIRNFPDYFFDVILIDGRSRVGSIKESVRKVNNTGYIILDNSERKEYTKGVNILLKNGFREIKIKGRGPMNDYEWQSSFFIKK